MHLSEICIYPVKSLGGVSVSSADVEPRGLKYDRRWMLVDSENVFMTQRDLPRLCLFKTTLSSDGFGVRAPDGATLSVPYETEGNLEQVQVWKDVVSAVPAAPEINEWFSDALGLSCRLVFMPSESHRQVDRDFAAEGEGVSFADGMPILVAGQASLDDLNSRLAEPLPMNRFRPNLVISGAQPWAEDSWSVLRLGEVELRLVKLCGRCKVTTTNQNTAEVGQEPLRTLATFRQVENKVMFGNNAIPKRLGRVEVGMAALIQ